MPGNRREGSLMRKVSILFMAAFLVMTVMAAPSFAQDYAPFEIFGGYNFASINGVGEKGEFMNGWNAAFSGNLNSTFGIKAEISGIYKSFEGDYKINAFSFMAGPQISGRFEVFPGASSVFGHALFGNARLGATEMNSINYFAMALGGGIDWGFGRIGVRAPQIDYYPWRKGGFNFNNYRISGGLVIRLGN